MKKFLTIFTAMFMAVNTFAQTIDRNTAMANYSNDANMRLIQRVLDTLYASGCDNCAIQRQQIAKIAKEYGYSDATASNLRQFSDQMQIVYGNQITGVMMMYKVNDDGYGYTVERYVPNALDKFIALSDGRPLIKVEGRPLTPVVRIVRSNMAPPATPPAPMVASAPIVQTPAPVAPAPVTAQAPVQKNEGGCNVTINVNQPGGNYGSYSTQQVVAIGQTIRGSETAPYIQPHTYGGNGYPGYGYGWNNAAGGYAYSYGNYAVGISGSISIGSNYPYGYGWNNCAGGTGYSYGGNYTSNCNQPVVTYGTNCGAVTGSSGGVYPRR